VRARGYEGLLPLKMTAAAGAGGPVAAGEWTV
jgi:hypothetical protein